MINLYGIFALLVVFQIKHFLADYPLQGKYMLGKFKSGWDFLGPLLAHVSVHGGMTAAICLFFKPHLWWLALVDMFIHFIMDRIKASPNYLGRFKALSAREFKEEASILMQAKDWHANPDKYDPNYNDYAAALEANALNNIKSNTYFWWALGLDQMVHHLTDLFIVYMILTY